MDKWIRTSDRLPEPRTDVLVYGPNGYITLAEYCEAGWSDLTTDGVHGWDVNEIEWWMPLPDKPAHLMLGAC